MLGDVHFEDEENWTVNNPSGINVLFVAVHEIGHALGIRFIKSFINFLTQTGNLFNIVIPGLSHSKAKGAIMQPFYAGYSPKLRLHPDDIEGIQSLYGKRDRRKIATTTNRPRPTDDKPSTRPRPTTSKPIRTTTASIKVGHDRPDLCKDSKIDAITTLDDGTVVAFKGINVKYYAVRTFKACKN